MCKQVRSYRGDLCKHIGTVGDQQPYTENLFSFKYSSISIPLCVEAELSLTYSGVNVPHQRKGIWARSRSMCAL